MSFFNFLVTNIPHRVDSIIRTITDITKADGYTEIKITIHNGGEFTIFTDRNEVLGHWRGEWLHRSYLTLEAALHDGLHFFRGSCPRKRPSEEEVDLFIETAK
nr:MAG TPA: hypothetical protein [Caudoviricetes sp.]